MNYVVPNDDGFYSGTTLRATLPDCPWSETRWVKCDCPAGSALDIAEGISRRMNTRSSYGTA